jgi:type IV pilus assembly protein PilE
MNKLFSTSLFIRRNKNTMSKLVSGFTLIELLIVIAIIGILSSVVLASLNTARTKGANAAVKLGMSNLRSQAELFYNDSLTYAGVCTSTQFANILGSATSAGGGPTSTMPCISDANGWSAYSNLKGVEGNNSYWCAGNSGSSKGINSISSWATSSCQ